MRCLKRKLLPNPGKDISFSDPAGIAGLDGRSKRVCRGLVSAFFLLEVLKRGSDNVAGIFVPATVYFIPHELIEFVGQVHTTCRHGVSVISLLLLQSTSAKPRFICRKNSPPITKAPTEKTVAVPRSRHGTTFPSSILR